MSLKLTVSNGDIAQVVNKFGAFYKDPNLEDPYQDNEWDAYRHVYSSAAYTEKFGSSTFSLHLLKHWRQIESKIRDSEKSRKNQGVSQLDFLFLII